MFKIYKTLVVTLIIVLGISINCSAKEYENFSKLIEDNKALDGKVVVVKGEAIGEPMKRGSHTWINISDGTTAIGIWLENSEAKKVKTFGNYKNKGDIVKVKAIYNKSCKEHDGEIDFHASKLEVTNMGYKTERFLKNTRVKLLIGLSIVTIIIMCIYFKYGRKN